MLKNLRLMFRKIYATEMSIRNQSSRDVNKQCRSDEITIKTGMHIPTHYHHYNKIAKETA